MKNRIRQLVREEIARMKGNRVRVNESSDANVITIYHPREVKTKSVIDRVRTLALQGVRSKDIRLVLKFVTGNPEEIFMQFEKIKNKVYFQLDDRF